MHNSASFFYPRRQSPLQEQEQYYQSTKTQRNQQKEHNRRRSKIKITATKEMSTTTSKLGKKYDRKEIEKLDKQFHSELRKMFRKSNCADCGKKHPNWATLKRGKFVCINCAQKLRADSSNRVKSVWELIYGTQMKWK